MITIGISAGDPAGIGLEVILKAIGPFLGAARWVLYSDLSSFERNHALFAPAMAWSSTLSEGETGLIVQDLGGTETIPGAGNAESGRRALATLDAAADDALSGRLDAIVTAPVSKQLIGSTFRGQTDHLAERSDGARVAMSFFTPTFKVVLTSTHVSLQQAIAGLSQQRCLDILHLVDEQFRRFGYPSPSIAVAALNPHAGEGGMFGSEEVEILQPAVDRGREAGLDVSGPYSADSLYYRAHAGEFDVVLAPYHDQGLIPVKLIARGASANVTLGLPFVRTSPDHGTAFEIAGKGIAEPEGMTTSMEWALELSRRQLRHSLQTP